MDLAQTLKDFRQANGLEQDGLAVLLDTTQQTISNWESGTMPRTAALNRINHLLRTYKKGEEPKPYVPPTYHPAITEIHEIPVDKDVQRAKLDAMRERDAQPYINSEYGTTRTIAESLGRIAEGHPPGSAVNFAAALTAKALLSPGAAVSEEALTRGMRFAPIGDPGYRSFMQEVAGALPGGMPFEIDARVDYQGMRMRADYLSPRVCAEVKEHSRGSPSLLHLETGIHRLNTLRKIFERQDAPRERYVLLLVAQQGSGNPRLMNRVMAEAALHDIHVFTVQSPEECAQLLTEMESGHMDEFDEELF